MRLTSVGDFDTYSGMARTDQPHKLAFDDFVALSTDFSKPINEKHRDLDYSRPETRAAWNGSKVKIPIWCNTCSEFFWQLPANHMALGHGCPPCGRNLRTQKKTKKDPVGDFKAKHGDAYDYSRINYVNVHTPVEIICPQHGSFWQKPNAHLSGNGCPECWETRRRAFGRARNQEYCETFVERAARIHKGAYSVLKAPAGAHDIAVLNCPAHGPFEQKAYSHTAGHGCPSCGVHTSYEQEAIAQMIEGLGLTVERDNRLVLGGHHIDVWVPEKNIGIEYHGSYWHTYDRAGNKHRKKWELAQAAGVRLIQVFDFEWLGRREACENRIKALMGFGESVGARECELREVPRGEALAFFERTHTQGGGSNPKVAYGLYKDGALLACMAFGPHRWAKPGAEGPELYRYASVGRVQGGFSKLLKAYITAHNPATIVSYCDLRWGDGRTYAGAGFEFSHLTVPDSWYTDGNNRISRQLLQRPPDGMTQTQWADKNGWKLVKGVGSQCWVWRSEHG